MQALLFVHQPSFIGQAALHCRKATTKVGDITIHGSEETHAEVEDGETDSKEC